MRQTPARPDTSESSDVDRLVRLRHRRHGWSWVAGGSTTGLVVYTVIGASLFANLTGTAETASVIPLFVLLALALAGLCAVIADTVRIHRAGPALRAASKASVSHHPLYAHAHRYPPRHLISWLFGIVMLVVMTSVTVAAAPAEVNSVAYLAGWEHQDTFNPLSYSQACSKGGCKTVTDGYLSGSGANVTWGSQVPLGQPFTVRGPVWDWGTGHNIISSDGTAIAMIAVGLFFDLIPILLLFVIAMVARTMRPLRRQSLIMPTAGPGGTPGLHRLDLP